MTFDSRGSNAWNQVPLADYEMHMQHKTVAQAQLLNKLTNKYLKKHQPNDLLFLGISGGNGLEHVNIDKTESVCGIDINDAYLEATRQRFGEKIRQLSLINADISTSNDSFIKADFVWAGLIFEYIDMQKGFAFVNNNTKARATLVITIQSNNGHQSVSQTGIESLKTVKDIFKTVDAEELKATAHKEGFELIGMEENVMPNGKSLLTYEFSRR